MPRAHKPRSGSLQFWPRKRAKRIYARIRSWINTDEVKALGFAGYKAGMSHVIYTDNRSKSITKGEKITFPISIIECPPLKILGVRCYQNNSYGSLVIYQINSQKLDKNLQRKISIPKKNKELKDVDLSRVDEVRLVAYTQPSLTGIGKKKPEVFELKIGGSVEKAFEYGKQALDREIKVSEIFETGQFVDVHGITKGYGFEGPIKRFGITLKAHKSEKKKRSAGNLGAWTPGKTSHTVPQHGQRGFHQRTEYNKQIFKISNNLQEIAMKGDFIHYGKIKNEYIILKGPILGPKKRMILLTNSIRGKKIQEKPEINYISLESKQ